MLYSLDLYFMVLCREISRKRRQARSNDVQWNYRI